MKRLFATAALATMTALAASAQEKKVTVNFSGYIMTQYQATLKEDANSNSFNIRLGRASVQGRAFDDFEYKVQVQINGNTSTLGNSPRLVDAFVEWQKHKEAKVKVGQFKRPFTFENPMHPIDQGFMGYSQNINKLAGFSDRSGEQACNGRDIGLQLQGDFLPAADGHDLIHYQVGLFNGQGINTKDVDNRKDVIGGLWVAPIKGLRIGAFGWAGSKARTDATTGKTVSLSQYRYAFGAEYNAGDWQLRSEYIHSTGYAFKKTYQNSGDEKDATVNTSLGNKADGVYALAIAPIVKGKLRFKARYDMYRQSAEWGTMKTQYEAGLNWLVNKNVTLLSEYAFVNDRTSAKHNYSMVDVELCVKF